MPPTRPRPSDRPQSEMSKESVRTAIIVGVIVGVLAIACLVIFLWTRRVKQSAKAGARSSESSESPHERSRPLQRQDKDLEIGVIQEPLPVYQTEPMEDERRLAMTAMNSEGRRNDAVNPTGPPH